MFLFQIIFKCHIPIVQIGLYIYGIYRHLPSYIKKEYSNAKKFAKF
jgi:hypothetical protein